MILYGFKEDFATSAIPQGQQFGSP